MNKDDILSKIPDTFEEFFKRLVNDFGLKDAKLEDLVVFKDEIANLFSAALFDASTESLNQEDFDVIEAYLLTHPDVSDVDAYFYFAAQKPEFEAVLKRVLDETYDQIGILKEKLDLL